MSLIPENNKNRLKVNFKSVFDFDIPKQLIADERTADLCIDYGIMGYSYSDAIDCVRYHQRIQAYNKLMEDSVVFSLFKLSNKS